MKRFTVWTCPTCGRSVSARGAIEILHECPRTPNWKLTAFVVREEAKTA